MRRARRGAMFNESEDDRRAFLGVLGAALGASALSACGETLEGAHATGAVPLIGATPVKWVDSVSTDLRAADAAAVGSTAVIARGYATNEDGGGGPFVWNASSTANDDGGTIINPNGIAPTPGRWMRVYTGPLDIRWFGARSGSPDHAPVNVAAIQAAVDAAALAHSGVNAGRVLVPAGQWSIDATITFSLIDSVILCSAGGAGSWTAPGAYGHHSTKLIWSGAVGGVMLDFADTMRCGVEGLMLDGGGSAGLAIRVNGRPCKGNVFEDVVIRNLASSGTGIRVGVIGNSNPDVAFNVFRRFVISECAIGIEQIGPQTVSNSYEDGVFVDFTQYGMSFAGGDINASRCFFAANSAAIADVYASNAVGRARFAFNSHEVRGQNGYLFEPAVQGNLRPRSTLFVGVRLLHQASGAGPHRCIDFRQDGHLTLIGCEFEGTAGVNQPEVYLELPDVGWSDLGLAQDIGCRYLNGARCVVKPVNGAFTSLYSNGDAALPDPGPVTGRHLMTNTRLTQHNGELRIQDNAWLNAGSYTTLGTKLWSYFGQLMIESAETRTGAHLVVVRNNGAQRFSVNAGGGPAFYGQSIGPMARPVVTGSRGGNAALASLLSALASFGLITDNTTA